MKRFFGRWYFWYFGSLDRSIANLREVRDSYRALNVEIYGEELARLLNDW